MVLAGSGGLAGGRAVFAEDQVEKRLLVMRASGLAQYVEVFVVLVDLPVGHFDAVGAAGDPTGGEASGFEHIGILRAQDEREEEERSQHTDSVARAW